MRIGIETSALRVDRGGTATYVAQLVDGLARRADGHRIETLSFGRGLRTRRTIGSRVNTLCRDVVWSQVGLPAVAGRRRLDLLHLTGPVIPLWTPCPRVVTVYDMGLLRYREFATPWMVYHARAVHPIAIRRADAIISISDFARGEIVEMLCLPRERITVIPLGVSPRFFAVPSAEDLADVRQRLDLRRPFILHVGVLSPRKNLERLMGAYRRLRAAGQIDHELVLAGSRGWRDEGILRRAATLDPSGRDIRWIGHVEDGDLPALYHLADLFAYPSLYEGFGIPPLEAMAAGTPVVASNAAAIPEVLGDAALLVDPTDEDALAEGLRRALLSEGTRRELRERGRARAATFTWERTVRETLAVYDRVAAQAPHGSARHGL